MIMQSCGQMSKIPKKIPAKTLIKMRVDRANAAGGLTSVFPNYSIIKCNDIDVHLHCFKGNTISKHLSQWMLNLTAKNVSQYYEGCQFANGDGWDPISVLKEMTSQKANIIIFSTSKSAPSIDKSEDLLGFLHYRFEIEFDIDCCYIWDLQLEENSRGKGIGTSIMDPLSSLCSKFQISTFFCTVQKANTTAMKFWKDKWKFEMDENSPDRCWDTSEYYAWEILSKTAF